jgi:uncharacterized coiled-coil protein SlyX
MKIFKRDLSATRRQVLEQTSQAAAALAKLRSDREKALVEADNIDEVKQIDAEIASQEKTVSILQDKLRALAGQLKDERQEQREQERTSQIAVIEKKLMSAICILN